MFENHSDELFKMRMAIFQVVLKCQVTNKGENKPISPSDGHKLAENFDREPAVNSAQGSEQGAEGDTNRIGL